jgi:hypothetical protein
VFADAVAHDEILTLEDDEPLDTTADADGDDTDTRRSRRRRRRGRLGLHRL